MVPSSLFIPFISFVKVCFAKVKAWDQKISDSIVAAGSMPVGSTAIISDPEEWIGYRLTRKSATEWVVSSRGKEEMRFSPNPPRFIVIFD